MDTYVEWLVEKKPGPANNLIRAGGYMLCGIAALGGIIISPVLFVPAVILAVCCYIFMPRLNVEYEYLYLQRSISVDRIFSKEKRQKAAEYDLDKMEIFAEEGAYQLDQYNNNSYKCVDFSSGYPGRRVFIMVIRDNEDKKKVRLEPDQRIVDAIRQLYPSKVFFK